MAHFGTKVTEELNEIYKGCDFNPDLDVYWDALDVSEESMMNILPPNVDVLGPRGVGSPSAAER